jgi:phosphonate transport system ATP-binding protein
MDVASNVLHGILNRRGTLQTMFNIWPQADILKALDILDRLGISEQAPKRAEALSGGQQQRVAIARALAGDPKVILADEPTGNLDSQRSVEIMEILTALNREQGLTIVMVTHEEAMAAFASRLITFIDGRLAQDEPVRRRA